MYKTVRSVEPQDDFLKLQVRVSTIVATRLSFLFLLLAVALLTTSCGSTAQAAGTRNNDEILGRLSLFGNLPAGFVNEPYNAVLAVGGGHSPYRFSISAGALPPGIALNPSTGAVAGKPTSAGTFSFEVVVIDSTGLDEGARTFTIVVGGGGGSVGTVKVSVSPTTAALSSNQIQQFTATISGTSNTRRHRTAPGIAANI